MLDDRGFDLNAFPEVGDDPIMQTKEDFRASTAKDKINAGVGVVIDPSTGKPQQLDVYREARRDYDPDTGYLNQIGHQPYLEEHARRLVFGEEIWGSMQQNLENDDRRPDNMVWAQSIGGTGGLALASALLRKGLRESKLLIDPGWGNHLKVFGEGLEISSYQHEDPDTRKYDHEAFIEALEAMPNGTAVLLQVCGYNGDGLDRTNEQWDEIIEICKSKSITPVLDFAYNGLAEGFDEDNYAIGKFHESGIRFFVCCSNSKNGGYNWRLGSIYADNVGSKDAAGRMQEWLNKSVIRPSYSNAPKEHAAIMAKILLDDKLRERYEAEIKSVRGRIDGTRDALADALGQGYEWVKDRSGLFVKMLPNKQGFSDAQTRHLRDDHGVLCVPNGRLNVAGFSTAEAPRVATAVKSALAM